MNANIGIAAAPTKRQLAIKLTLDPTSTINGFNYVFTSMMLAKLNSLIEEKKFLSAPPYDHGGNEGVTWYLTPIAKVVLYRLVQQIPCIDFQEGGSSTSDREVKELVAAATEFLAIFEVKLK